MMLVKKHSNMNSLIISVCDSDILGEKFEEGNLQLDLTSEFYKGETTSNEELLKLIPNADSIMLVGEESVNFALKNNLAEKEEIKKIKKIPHLQILLIKKV